MPSGGLCPLPFAEKVRTCSVERPNGVAWQKDLGCDLRYPIPYGRRCFPSLSMPRTALRKSSARFSVHRPQLSQSLSLLLHPERRGFTGETQNGTLEVQTREGGFPLS
jgi:hypothetical protein